jgi:hypothetical protein
MQELLTNPVVQSSVAPFAVALILAALLFPVRLAGLAAAGGFFATVWMMGTFGLSPLTATRKIVLVGAAAPVLGVLADLAFKPTRVTGPVLGALFGAAALWVFWSVLQQRPAAQLALYGAALFAFVMWTVAFAAALHAQPVRSGAAGLGLGLGTGAAAVLGGSALLGQYGLALGAACGGFLLVVMVLGARVAAGATLTLTFSVIAVLVAAGAVFLAQLPWAALAALALVPVVVRLPLPEKSPSWLQAVAGSLYAFVAAGAGCAIAWVASRGAQA